MTNDPRLETYLTTLEKVLKPFPVSDRAEIVTEIKSHVLSILERDPEARLDSVLAALGEPETVANRYLLERGLKPTKPPISPIVKWLVIGFLGTFAMLLIFVVVVVAKFTPLLEVDDDKDRVSLLGGIIKVDGEKGSIEIPGELRGDLDLSWDSDGERRSFHGSVPVEKGQTLAVTFSNGKFEVSNAPDASFAWTCATRSAVSDPSPARDANGVRLDLASLRGVRCELAVPEGAKLALEGLNGKVEFEDPHFDVAAALTNGKVTFSPDDDVAYRYAISVTNGRTDSFVSSDAPDARSIAIRVVNGKIIRGK